MLDDPRYKLVISHEAGDEGLEYQKRLMDMAAEENVEIHFVSTRIGEVRQFNRSGEKVYTLWDIYPHADLVSYPSLHEGFGNALLEAIYFKIPVILNRYSIYIQDIEPKGFRLMEMDGFVTNRLVKEVRRVMEDRDYHREMVDHNYKVARRFYSYSVLKRRLRTLIISLSGVNHA